MVKRDYDLKISLFKKSEELGKSTGSIAVNLIREILVDKGAANIILPTGTSQFETLNQLIAEPDIDWGKVIMFHLDVWIGLPIAAFFWTEFLPHCFYKGNI